MANKKPRASVSIGTPTIMPAEQQQAPMQMEPIYNTPNGAAPGQNPMDANIPLTSSSDEKQAYMAAMLQLIAGKQAQKQKARMIARTASDKMDPMAALSAAERQNSQYAPGEWYDTEMTGDQMYGVPHLGPDAGTRIPFPPGGDKTDYDDLMFKKSYPEMYRTPARKK